MPVYYTNQAIKNDWLEISEIKKKFKKVVDSNYQT